MTAPRGYRPLKTGRGRPTAAPPRAVHVEKVQCPSRTPGGWHWLTNEGAVTLCRVCRVDWAALDAVARGGAA